MRKWSLLSTILILLVACTCQVPPFLEGFLGSQGEARGEMIEYDDNARGSIEEGGHEYWSFSGRTGDQITISMDSDDFDTFLVLFGPDDNFLALNDDGGSDFNAMIRRFVLPSSGIHNIVAMSYGSYGEGDYRLELMRTDEGRDPAEIGGGSISYGESVAGDLRTRTVDVWTFAGEAGDRVTISMESDEFDTYLDVWGPDLTHVADNDDGGEGSNSLVEGLTLPASGTYSIVARGYGDRERGPYTLSLE
jgi:serine protease Do